MNNEEAERAYEKGLKELKENKNYVKAMKFFKISNRLSPSREKLDHIRECNILLQTTSPDSNYTPTSSEAASSRNNTILESSMKLFMDVKAKLTYFEGKYIAESYKPILRALALLILFVIVGKFIFKQDMMLGKLPGDINYSAGGMQVFFPMTTCSLISFLFPIVYNWYHSYRR